MKRFMKVHDLSLNQVYKSFRYLKCLMIIAVMNLIMKNLLKFLIVFQIDLQVN
jgi:hypothetical protein